MMPVPPKQYQALVGRHFRDIGPNGLKRAVRVDAIIFNPYHRWGPWLAACWNEGLIHHGPHPRKIDRFFQAGEYEELKD